MVKAELITKSGMKISIEGSSEEVGELLEDMERRERRIEERKEFMKRMMEQREEKLKIRNKLIHGGDIKLTDVLEALIEKKFFNDGKQIRDIMIRLEHEGISAPSSTIHPLLARLVAKRKLNRKKGESGNWEYTKGS